MEYPIATITKRERAVVKKGNGYFELMVRGGVTPPTV
jgi:hypothetical protein